MFALKNACFLLALLFFLPLSFALDAPVVTSSTHPEGVWAGMPMEFKWGAVEGAHQYCYALTSSTDAPNFSIMACTSGTSAYPPQKISSGNYYFHVNSGTPESASAPYHVKLDVECRSRPVLSAEAMPDGSIQLDWEAPEDDASGLKEYNLYRKLMGGFDIRYTPIYLVLPASTASVNDFNEMTQNTTYHYKIRAVDNADNFCIESNEAYARTVAKCDLDIIFSTSLSADKKSLGLGITSSEPIYHGGLSAVLPDGSAKTFFEDAESFTKWQDSLSLSGLNEGYIDFSLAAKEFFGDDCGFERRFVYDVTPPTVSFVSPKYNDRVSEIVPLNVKVEDTGAFKSGLEAPSFFLRNGNDWAKLGDGVAGEGGVYSFGWDSFSTENGQRELKVVLADLGGNKAEVSVAVMVLNAFDSVLDANTAIAQAVDAREKALQAMWGLEGKAIFSEDENRLVSEAEAKLGEAISLSARPDLESQTNAKALIAEAILLFQESQSVVQTSVYQSADFIFNKEQASILLNAAGVSGAAQQQAVEMIGKADPKRQLQILRVVDGNSEYYRALINVSFSLDVNILADSNSGDNVLQVIEVVPKEFAEYAAELDSNIAFDVLYDDPKLSFILTRDDYKKKGFSYALKSNLSQQQADSLIAENIVNKFVAPPILLPVGTVPVGLNISSGLLLFVAVAVVFVVAMLVVLVVLKRRGSEQNDFSGKPQKFGFAPKEGVLEPGHEKPAPTLPREAQKRAFSGIKMPKLGKKKNESPLSVFGKK